MARAVIITSYLEYPVDLPALLLPEDFIVCLDGGFDIARGQGIRPDLLLGDFDSLQSPVPESAAAGVDFPVLRYPAEKDYTDLELAFRVLDPRRTPDLLIIGGLGGRLDQTLTNVQMLQRYTASPAEWAQIQDEGGAKAGPPAEWVRPQKGSASEGASAAGVSAEETAIDELTCGSLNYGSFRRYRHIELMDGRSSCFAVHADADRFVSIPRKEGSFLSLLPLSDECGGVDLEGVKYPLKDGHLRRGTTLSISNEFRAPEARLRVRSGSLLVIITRGNRNDAGHDFEKNTR